MISKGINIIDDERRKITGDYIGSQLLTNGMMIHTTHGIFRYFRSEITKVSDQSWMTTLNKTEGRG